MKATENSLSKSAEHENLAFIKEVAKYFMDFLETDFHKRRNPKRSIQFRNSSNLLVGLNVGKYAGFNTKAGKLIAHAFDKMNFGELQKGVYRTNIPKNLIDLVKLQSKKITAKEISGIVSELSEGIEKAAVLHQKEYDKAYTAALESVSGIIKSKLVLPFVSNLEKPIENLDLGDEGSIFLMEEELTMVLVSLVDDKVSEVLKQLLAQVKVNIEKEIKDVFDVKEVKSALVSFFESFQVGDLFSEIYEMERNRSILDKQEFYFYFCDISFDKVKYPIFYIPFNISKQNDVLIVEFDSQVYINKKALEYVTQEYNRETGHHGSLEKISERIIYLAQFQEKGSFLSFVTEIMDEISNFFELDSKIDISSGQSSVAKSLWVKTSNARYIALFDKSDEALVNDYEDILNLLSEDNSILAGAFNTLVDDFIYNEPKRFNTEVEDEWENTKVKDRLVFESPIPLNEEQLQILNAIRKKDCKYIIVEGPPGTGKSHTITAIIFDYIRSGKSILVLSDKKEALDVVEGNITGTLNRVRRDKNFQNPILRLGKVGNNYQHILATPTIENIKTHLKAVRKNHGLLGENISKISDTLRAGLEEEASAYKEVDLKEIQELAALEGFFEENGFPLEIPPEGLDNELLADELQETYAVLKRLRQSLSEYEFDHDPSVKVGEDLLGKAKLSISLLEKFNTEYRDFLDSKDGQEILIVLNKNFEKFTLSDDEMSRLEDCEQAFSSENSLNEIVSIAAPDNFSQIEPVLEKLSFFKKILDDLNAAFGHRLAVLSLGATFTDFNYKQIEWFLGEYESIKLPIVGYLLGRRRLNELNEKFKDVFRADALPNTSRLVEDLKEIQLIIAEISRYRSRVPVGMDFDLVKAVLSLAKDSKLQGGISKLYSSVSEYGRIVSILQKSEWFGIFEPKNIGGIKKIKIAKSILSVICDFNESSKKLNHVGVLSKLKDIFDDKNIIEEIDSLERYHDYLSAIRENHDDIEYASMIFEDYPYLVDQMGIQKDSLKTFLENKFFEIDEFEYTKFVRLIALQQKIESDFAAIQSLDYENQKKNIEQLVTTQMTYILDDQLIKFYETSPATAKTLREIIRSKKRFPKEEFLKLKQAFPCILAGIRDYAEFIPLEPEIFDLVIIDEASQVSIAQAFPALLRAKKILILGDKKQFSNVKSAQAKSDTNREYLNSLKEAFFRCISDDDSKVVKLEKFNIKTSILEFFEFIANYNTQLRKHFRGYKEIISYSNKYFYQDSLQVMKIRGRQIDDVLKFSILKSDVDTAEPIQNTNTSEIEFVISEMKKLYEEGSTATIGIITPHTNQQKIFVEAISMLPEKDYFYERMDLKIMTFDTCQGEERDIIFYSMVATEEHDRLWGVFIKNLSDIDIEEEGKIKAQRLNVGFSRAKERMHFVLSKPVDKFGGAIGEALRHYANLLNEAKKEKLPDSTDKRSHMEPQVLHWFYQTEFYKDNKDRVEFIPQFELGKYLQQLDKFYNHPKYKVDFLLIYTDESGKENKIIIEYDGFKEHFTDLNLVNDENYEMYYSEDDLYRQKVLESYGYKFLRINKFNIGKNPVETLDERLGKILNKRPVVNNALAQIHSTIDGLENGNMKECTKCKNVRTLSDFKDPRLSTGYGRVCRPCKKKRVYYY